MAESNRRPDEEEVIVDLSGPSWDELIAGALLELASKHLPAHPESSSSEKTSQSRSALKTFQKIYDRI